MLKLAYLATDNPTQKTFSPCYGVFSRLQTQKKKKNITFPIFTVYNVHQVFFKRTCCYLEAQLTMVVPKSALSVCLIRL